MRIGLQPRAVAAKWLAPPLLALLAALPTHAQIAVRNQGYIPFSDPPINYRSDELHDPVTRLQHRLEAHDAELQYEPEHGYLRSLLQLLDIPIVSQTLVFSKTSFQYPKISPEHPRALYFNDDVYVGAVHEGKALEVVSFDPTQGAIFYLLDEHEVDHPAFERAELDCTQCHIAAGTRGIPGVLLRSVYPTSTGTLVAGAKTFITDQESPFSERWGGWYVTGDLQGTAHMGNAVVRSLASEAPADGSAPAVKLVTLDAHLDTSSFLAPGSDTVAHLVLAHQTQMHNLITLANYKTRLARYALARTAGASGPDPGADWDSIRPQVERPVEQLLRYLLFAGEAALPETGSDPLGSSAFAAQFAARGPRDSRGRSLRDFDLRTRIFRYPCSYLIYSDSFESLPEPTKSHVYRRLLEILSGQDHSAEFARLSAQDRRAIIEILLETKPQLPPEWHEFARANHLTLKGSVSRARKTPHADQD